MSFALPSAGGLRDDKYRRVSSSPDVFLCSISRNNSTVLTCLHGPTPPLLTLPPLPLPRVPRLCPSWITRARFSPNTTHTQTDWQALGKSGPDERRRDPPPLPRGPARPPADRGVAGGSHPVRGNPGPGQLGRRRVPAGVARQTAMIYRCVVGWRARPKKYCTAPTSFHPHFSVFGWRLPWPWGRGTIRYSFFVGRTGATGPFMPPYFFFDFTFLCISAELFPYEEHHKVQVLGLPSTLEKGF